VKKIVVVCLSLIALNCYAANTLGTCKKITSLSQSIELTGKKCPRCCPPWDPDPCCVKC